MTEPVKPVLILQLRPEDAASDSEYAAFLEKARLRAEETVRLRLEATSLPESFSLDDYSAVIVGGGPGCVSDDPATRDPAEARAEAEILSLLPQIIEEDKPFMGCCAGIGILAHYLGGDVSKTRYSEPVSAVEGTLTDAGKADPLLAGLPERFNIFVGHKEAVQDLPTGAVHLMSSEACPYQMIRTGKNVYATQFHPEADGPVFAERIRIYSGHGYFKPEEADLLTNQCLTTEVTQPEKILRRFVELYVRSSTYTSA
ncbi:MAG: glutamine amidotransferase [Pseudomonadota bacterium]